MKIQEGDAVSSAVMDRGVDVDECEQQKDEKLDEICEKSEENEELKDKPEEVELLPDIGPDIGKTGETEADVDTNIDNLSQSTPVSSPANKSDYKSEKIILTCDVCSREFKNMRGKHIHEFTCRKAAAKAKGCNRSKDVIDGDQSLEDGDIKNHKLREEMNDYGDGNKSYNLRESSSSIFYDEESEEGGELESTPVAKRKKIHYTRKGKRVLPDKNGKYPCPYCQRKLGSSYTLKIHMRFHTGEKPFSCPQCDERFERQDYVGRHAIIHSGTGGKEGKAKEQMRVPRRYKLKRFNNTSTPTVTHIVKKLRLNTVKNKTVAAQKWEFACTLCDDVSFAKQYHLENHMRYVHNGSKPFPCTACGEGFSRRDYLLKHAFKCPGLGGSEPANEKDLSEDAVEEEEDEEEKESLKTKARKSEQQPQVEEKFDCPECGKVLSSKINLRGHMVQHTGRGIPCPDCNKNFGRKSNMQQHRANVHGWPAKNTSQFPGQQIVCTECGEVFPSAAECLTHMNKFHEKADRKVAPLKLKLNGKMSKKETFSCKLCHQEFSCELQLEEHTAAAHTDPSKKLKCKLCDRFFTHQHNLSSHMAHKHRGRRPFMCPQCKKTFIMAHHMTAHIRYIHSANKKPFACKQCDRSYALQSDLKKHTKSHNKRSGLNGGPKVPKLESKFNPFLEEDDDESLYDDEDDVMFVDADAASEKPDKDEEHEQKEMDLGNVENNLRMQLAEQKRAFEAELERALEEQRCLANKRIEIYKNVVENLQEKNAKTTKLIAGVKSVLKDMSKQLLTKDQALSEYEDRIKKYKDRIRRIEESETELRIALETLENSKEEIVNGSIDVGGAPRATDGEDAPTVSSKVDTVTPDRVQLKQKVKCSWLKLSDRIRNKSSESDS